MSLQDFLDGRHGAAENLRAIEFAARYTINLLHEINDDGFSAKVSAAVIPAADASRPPKSGMLQRYRTNRAPNSSFLQLPIVAPALLSRKVMELPSMRMIPTHRSSTQQLRINKDSGRSPSNSTSSTGFLTLLDAAELVHRFHTSTNNAASSLHSPQILPDSIALAPDKSTVLISAATSSALIPAATSSVLIPAATSSALIPAATSSALISAASSSALISAASSSALIPAATSSAMIPVASINTPRTSVVLRDNPREAIARTHGLSHTTPTRSSKRMSSHVASARIIANSNRGRGSLVPVATADLSSLEIVTNRAITSEERIAELELKLQETQAKLDEAEQNSVLCLLCYSRPRSVLFGCGHFCCCLECAETQRRSLDRNCPWCKKRISAVTWTTDVKL